MLKKYNQTIRIFIWSTDFLLIFICWISAYWLRFGMRLIPSSGDLPTFHEHLYLSIYILSAFILVFNWLDLYKPMRLSTATEQFISIVRATSLAIFLAIFLIYFFKKGVHYSRLTIVFFWMTTVIVLFLARISVIKLLRVFRKKGYNLKHVVIVGSGKLAKEVARKIMDHLEYGFHIVGFLSKDPKEIDKPVIDEIKVIGTYGDLKEIAVVKKLDQVIFALPSEEERMIRVLLGYIDNEIIDVKIILELANIFTLRKDAEELDGFSVLSLRESPLFGWRGMVKRLLDILGSILGMVIFLPLICLIGLLIKLTSSGPVFYKQERMGMDGKRFILYKFRTMREDAESNTGPVWATKEDPRRTSVGRVLRKISLDELPQFFNVLRGDLSLVGPRPERPEFISEFRNRIPRYMFRHKIKPGMTGWAQIHGLRGDSSLEDRINYDLFYIEHWSIALDLKILLLTLPAILKCRGAY